jgi:hypothetical protein
MAPVFAQPFCIVTQVKGGGLAAGPKHLSCLAQVGDGELVIIEPPAQIVDRAPVTAVEVFDGPWLQRKVGVATYLRMNGRQWCVDFSSVSTGQKMRSGEVLNAVVTAGGPASFRTGKEASRAFAEALVSQGAIDQRKATSGR